MLFEQPPDLALAVDRDAVFPQQRRRHAVACGQPAGERPVVDRAGAAAWAALLQQRDLTAAEARKMQRLFRAVPCLLYTSDAADE